MSALRPGTLILLMEDNAANNQTARLALEEELGIPVLTLWGVKQAIFLEEEKEEEA